MVVSTVVALGVLALRHAGYLETWELAAYDWSLQIAPKEVGLSPSVVVVGISESDIQALNHWPLDDSLLAAALKKLLEFGPRAIGVDIYRDLPVGQGHQELLTTLADNPNIIMVMKFGGAAQASVLPPPTLMGTEQVGFNDVLVDRDGIVRRALLFLDDDAKVAYSFALRLALHYLRKEGISPQPDPVNSQYMRLGTTTFRPLEPMDGGYVALDARGYQFLVDYKHTDDAFRSYPFAAVLSGQIPREAINDKVVLIGVTAESVPDVFHTPLSSRSASDHQNTYGVTIHTHVVDQILRAALTQARPLVTWTDKQEAAWIIVWALAGGLIGMWVRSAWRFSLMAATGVFVLALLVEFLFVRGIWIPFVPPAMVWLTSAALITAYISNEEREQRALLMQLFSRHVSPQVADTIWEQREQFFDGGRPRSQKLIVTVLFTDLEGFTAVSEKMEPKALMDWTNCYIDAMAQEVMRHEGVVDDYYGDAVKANFGVPLARQTEAEIKQDAINAVACALDMENAMNKLCTVWQERHMPRVRLRIGIFTGPAVAGSIGSAQRLKYTTVGDTVNIAARLESYDKALSETTFGNSSCRVLIGESTLHYVADRYQTVPVGLLSLKGKDTKIAVFHVLGHIEMASREMKWEEQIS